MSAGNQIPFIRRVIGDVLLALVILLAADALFVMPAKINAVVLKADYRKVFMYELILCAILLLFALDVRFSLFTRWKPAILRGIGWVLRVVIVLLSAVILFFCGKVITGGLIHTAGQAEYAIVLGLALENGKPVPDLVARLDTAKAYLEKYPEAQLILTGGNADETGRTEAAVMRDLLTGKGVPEDRLILEDQAATTKENFQNIAGMLQADEPVVMISSNYHMDRAVRNAEEAGFTQVMRLPAPSGFFAYGANMLSEVVLDLNDLTKRQ
ncbi:MAG: YdcF family protein [Clostridia bacterium]|nr:YdcF family protein [Clostridia bacterium]